MNVYAGFGLQKQKILILSIETNHNLYKKTLGQLETMPTNF